ncbi:hypothetical protein MAQ5080_01539 [Marinomonas aquimarina]|uniref:DUF2007 domain-containing protein n=1 Tax=Marinomonas aquimarina TaxID=295068 RepID=A0A1A8TAL1_9GAMM|nr:DUF6164 family protein [Marinomonas aquimarina]SBS29915.1 hypothetical protein MAQ5080_01539 [Marinomonas aquimarina]
MAQLVFRLKNVPDEEADDIRALLNEHEIEFYETSAGRWQISMAGIWVRDKEQAQRAKALIAEDQSQRAARAQQITARDWIAGFLTHARQNPVEFAFTLVALLLVLSLSVIPFYIGKQLAS